MKLFNFLGDQPFAIVYNEGHCVDRGFVEEFQDMRQDLDDEEDGINPADGMMDCPHCDAPFKAKFIGRI